MGTWPGDGFIVLLLFIFITCVLVEIIPHHARLLLHPAVGEPQQGKTQDRSPHDHSRSCWSDTIWTVPLHCTVSCRVSLVTLVVLLSSSGEYSVHRPLSSRGRGQRVSWLSLAERVRWPESVYWASCWTEIFLCRSWPLYQQVVVEKLHRSWVMGWAAGRVSDNL